MGYVDIHCHLLYGIDDGCRTADDTLRMAKALVSLGYEAVAPGPDARPEYPSGDVALCASRRAEVEKLLAAEGVALELHPGAENFLDEAFLARVGRGEPRGIGISQRYLLVELPH